MGSKSAKKICDHQGLEPGEAVVDACYGLGKGVLAAADFVSLGGLHVPGAEHPSDFVVALNGLVAP